MLFDATNRQRSFTKQHLIFTIIVTVYFLYITQFIANAVEDMGIKRKQKEKEMLDDIFASTVMINKAKELIGKNYMYLYLPVHRASPLELLRNVIVGSFHQCAYILSLLCLFHSAADERKKQEDKEYHKRYQEQLYQENLENIERKQKEKLKMFAEEK